MPNHPKPKACEVEAVAKAIAQTDCPRSRWLDIPYMPEYPAYKRYARAALVRIRALAAARRSKRK